jgi:Flp pilus assembly protein TadD/predicted O-methyltransferase YrrM
VVARSDQLSEQTGDAKAAEAETLLNQAAACTKRGETEQAERLIRTLLARKPQHAGALYELGRISYRAGNKTAAADCLRKAIASEPGNGRFHNDLGCLLVELGDRQQAVRAFTCALEINPDDAEAISNIGTSHLAEGHIIDSVAAFRRAMQIDPLQLNARINLDSALMNAVPTWHFAMMNDAPRNAAYDEAIRRVVPGRSVLDIGTGAGLLAMMAARAGAKSVTSCEQTPWIAAKAREVVAANGLGDRIKLVAKHSTDLRIGPDLSERAEVLVTEVFGTAAINELVIPTVTHAHAQLLQPGATVVPNAASVRAYLAGGPALEGYFFVDRAAGFTISAFNDFARLKMDLQVNCVPHDVLSDDFEVYRLDLTRPPLQPEKRVIEVVATRPGRCFGVVQWLRLVLAEGLVYENRPSPGAPIDGWGHMLYRFSEPIDLSVGDRVRLAVQHNRRTLLIWNLPDSA